MDKTLSTTTHRRRCVALFGEETSSDGVRLPPIAAFRTTEEERVEKDTEYRAMFELPPHNATLFAGEDVLSAQEETECVINRADYLVALRAIIGDVACSLVGLCKKTGLFFGI